VRGGKKKNWVMDTTREKEKNGTKRFDGPLHLYRGGGQIQAPERGREQTVGAAKKK